MADICAGVAVPASITATVLLQYVMVVREDLVLHHETPRPCHRHTVPSHACREYAVEHINAARHALHKAIRRSYPHQIARLVLRQMLGRMFEHLIHQFLRLADGKTAHRVAGEIHLDKRFHALGAKLLIHAALHDAEQPLVVPCHRFLAPLRPAQRPSEGLLRIIEIGGIRHTLVEGHHDIGAQRRLHLDGNLRRKELFRAVDMRAERHALLGYLPKLAEAEYLKPAAVCQNSPIPVHELMQSARFANQIHPRTKKQMIGIRQDNARAEVFELIRRDRLDGRLRTHRHKNRRWEAPVGRMQNARARAGSLIPLYQFVSDCRQIKSPFHK